MHYFFFKSIKVINTATIKADSAATIIYALNGIALQPIVAIIPDELGLSFTISLTFLALLINDFRKFKNVIVMLVSGIVATIGYNIIPFKAYIIVSAISALIVATLLTFIKKNNK